MVIKFKRLFKRSIFICFNLNLDKATKQFKTGLYIWLDNGDTKASFKTEVEYHKELRDKLVGQGFELIPTK